MRFDRRAGAVKQLRGGGVFECGPPMLTHMPAARTAEAEGPFIALNWHRFKTLGCYGARNRALPDVSIVDIVSVSCSCSDAWLQLQKNISFGTEIHRCRF